VLIAEHKTVAGSLSPHIAALIALAFVRLLYVREVRIHNPPDHSNRFDGTTLRPKC
jgi:hypothetical protein